MSNGFASLDLPEIYPGQMEIKFPRTFNPEQMGCVFPKDCGNKIRLNSSFMKKELGLGGMDDNSLFSPGQITEVLCPFCKQGSLKLKRIAPAYSDGGYGFGTVYHIGNDYEFECSAGCGADFFGNIQWMNIF